MTITSSSVSHSVSLGVEAAERFHDGVKVAQQPEGRCINPPKAVLGLQKDRAWRIGRELGFADAGNAIDQKPWWTRVPTTAEGCERDLRKEGLGLVLRDMLLPAKEEAFA